MNFFVFFVQRTRMQTNTYSFAHWYAVPFQELHSYLVFKELCMGPVKLLLASISHDTRLIVYSFFISLVKCYRLFSPQC